MKKQQVLNKLNTLESSEMQGGHEPYALVDLTEDVIFEMEDVGISKEELMRYGDDETFCKWAFAIHEGYATEAKADGTLIWEDT